MRPISKNRLRKIASGEVKLNGKSTFKRMSAEEFRVKDKKEREELMSAMFDKTGHSKGEQRKRSIAAADKWFSIFIRLRDAGPEGRAKCVTCSHVGPWKSLQCGHYVTRGHQATRYDERNSNAQCRGCNYNGGQHLKHAAAIERKHGAGTAEALHQKGGMRCSRTTSDFLFLADTYRKKVEWIRQHEPGKFLGEVDPAHILQLLPDALS